MATIVHLEIKTSKPHEHHYYGCKSLVYDIYGEDLLGMSEYRWRAYPLSPDHPFENDKCIVRKAEVISKKTNRGGNLRTDNPRKRVAD